MKKKLIIFGQDGTGKEIAETVSLYYSNVFDDFINIFFDTDFSETGIIEEEIFSKDYEVYFIVSFADYELRKECISFASNYKNFLPFSIINKESYQAPSAKIGNGCFIAANSSISTGALLNDHILVNLNVSIGHDVCIEEHVIILPGARVSGNVKIGEGTLVGSNSFIFQGVNVGKENHIDALTYISKDLDEGMISMSSSTKTLKRLKNSK